MIQKPRIIKFVRLIIVLLVLAVILEGWMVSRLSTYGDKIDQLREVKSSLNLENELLRNQISEKSALSEVEFKASEYGFNFAQTIKYLKDESP